MYTYYNVSYSLYEQVYYNTHYADDTATHLSDASQRASRSSRERLFIVDFCVCLVAASSTRHTDRQTASRPPTINVSVRVDPPPPPPPPSRLKHARQR